MACAGPAAPSPSLRAGAYLLTIVTDRHSDGTRSCVEADGVSGVALANNDVLVQLVADGSRFRGIQAAGTGGSLDLNLSLSANSSAGSVTGVITGVAVTISQVPGTLHPAELAFGGLPDGAATLQGTVESTGSASGRFSGGLTYTFFDPLRIYPCHNTNTTWKLTPQ